MSAIGKHVINSSFHVSTDWCEQGTAIENAVKKEQANLVDNLIKGIFENINNIMDEFVIPKALSNTMNFSTEIDYQYFRESYKIAENRFIVFELAIFNREFCKTEYDGYNGFRMGMYYTNQEAESSLNGSLSCTYSILRDYTATCKATTAYKDIVVGDVTKNYQLYSCDASLQIYLNTLDNGVIKIVNLYEEFSQYNCMGKITVNNITYALATNSQYFALTNDNNATYYLTAQLISNIARLDDPNYLLCLPVYVSTAVDEQGMIFKDKKVSNALQTGGLIENSKYKVGGRDYYCFGGCLLIGI